MLALPLRIGEIEGPPGGPANEALLGVPGGIGWLGTEI